MEEVKIALGNWLEKNKKGDLERESFFEMTRKRFDNL